MAMNRAILVLPILAMSWCGSAAADTSILIVQSGTVMVDTGDGFAPATSGMEIAPGTRIMVQADAIAQLQPSSGGCGVALPTQSIATAPAAVQCTASSEANDGGSSSPSSPPASAEVAAPTALSPTVIVGGVALAAGVGVAASTLGKSSQHSASP